MKIKQLFDTWHEDTSLRQAIGITAEAKFQMRWICKCGGKFGLYYANKHPGSPDFQCAACGQYVEVKSNTKSYKRDNVAISRIPFENYPGETIIAYCESDSTWTGIFRRDAIVTSGPHPSTHTTMPTEFYWISLRNFAPLLVYLQERV